MKRVYVDGQNFLYKAAEVLIEHGKISSKDELTKIDIRSLVENIVGVGVEIVFYGAKVQVRRDLDDSILEKTTRFSDVVRRLRNTLKNQEITFNEVGKLKVRDSVCVITVSTEICVCKKRVLMLVLRWILSLIH